MKKITEQPNGETAKVRVLFGSTGVFSEFALVIAGKQSVITEADTSYAGQPLTIVFHTHDENASISIQGVRPSNCVV